MTRIHLGTHEGFDLSGIHVGGFTGDTAARQHGELMSGQKNGVRPSVLGDDNRVTLSAILISPDILLELGR